MKIKLIVIEGIDGSGKTTLAKNLAKHFPHCIYTAEPTFKFKKINKHLRDIAYFHLTDRTVESIAFAMDHAFHLAELIVPEICKGNLVVCDRWASYSSRAYQGGIAHIFSELHDIKPSVILHVKIPPEEAIKRLKNRQIGQLSQFEILETLKGASAAYSEMFMFEKNVIELNGMLSEKELFDTACKELSRLGD